eukprot:351975-Prymnesium_polylepis.1
MSYITYPRLRESLPRLSLVQCHAASPAHHSLFSGGASSHLRPARHTSQLCRHAVPRLRCHGVLADDVVAAHAARAAAGRHDGGAPGEPRHRSRTFSCWARRAARISGVCACASRPVCSVSDALTRAPPVPDRRCRTAAPSSISSARPTLRPLTRRSSSTTASRATRSCSATAASRR